MLKVKREEQGKTVQEMVLQLRTINPAINLGIYCGAEEHICLLPADQLAAAARYLGCTPPELVDAGQYLVPGATQLAAADNTIAAEAAAAETSAAEARATETMAAGEIAIGETAAGELASGELAIGETAAGETIAEQQTIDSPMAASTYSAAELLDAYPVVGILPLTMERGIVLDADTADGNCSGTGCSGGNYNTGNCKGTSCNGGNCNNVNCSGTDCNGSSNCGGSYNDGLVSPCRQRRYLRRQRVEFSLDREQFNWEQIKLNVINRRGFTSQSDFFVMLLEFAINCPALTRDDGRRVLQQMQTLYEREQQ